MKNRLFLFFLISLFAFSFQNCQKGEDEQVVSQEQNFEKLLESKLALLQNENDALIMFKEKDEYKINYEKNLLNFYFDSPISANKNARVSSCSKSAGTEVCSGSGYSFAKCGQGYLDQGCALTVWRDSNGIYHAKIAQL